MCTDEDMKKLEETLNKKKIKYKDTIIEYIKSYIQIDQSKSEYDKARELKKQNESNIKRLSEKIKTEKAIIDALKQLSGPESVKMQKEKEELLSELENELKTQQQETKKIVKSRDSASSKTYRYEPSLGYLEDDVEHAAVSLSYSHMQCCMDLYDRMKENTDITDVDECVKEIIQKITKVCGL